MSKKKRETPSNGRYAYEGLERVIHEKARLGIVTSLAAHPDGLLFSQLKEMCSLTDGNLNRHLQVLTEAEFIEIWKHQGEGRPQTLCRLTTLGRKKLTEYVAELEKVVRDALSASEPLPKRKPGDEWSLA
ncbi:MAG: transcriptional regulator [Planctomycetota bacterium]